MMVRRPLFECYSCYNYCVFKKNFSQKLVLKIQNELGAS